MKKQISLIFLLLPVFLFLSLMKVTDVSAAMDCAALSSNKFPPSSECMAVPCSNAYKWVLMPKQPDASKYGYTNGTAANACAVKSDCPANTSDSSNVNSADSNWCYQFNDGTRCIQLQHIQGQTCSGYVDPNSRCDSTVTAKTQLNSACASCIDTNDPRLAGAIKGLNANLFANCSNNQIISYWCDGGVSSAATADCSGRRTGTGVCATSCGGGGGGGGGSCSANVEEARKQLIQAGGSFQNSSCDAVTNAVCSNCTVFVPPNAIRTALCPTNSCSDTAVFTTHYRIAEDATDLNSAEWEVYTGAAMPRDYIFKDKTSGLKTIFVQFKDINGGISCGENKSYCTVQVRVLGDPPVVTACSLSFEGNNTITLLNLTGTNFGSTKGTIKNEDTPLETRAWKDGSVQAVWPNASTGQNLSVILTNSEGLSSDVACSGVSPLALGVKVFCRAPSGHQTSNVDLTLAPVESQSGAVIKQKVQIDKDGVIQGLNQKLEAGRQYNLSLKAPKGLRRTVSFTAEEGTTNLSKFILPIGDISPVDGGDGVINSLDKSELNRQWNIAGNATGRAGDFNQDGRVNSVDWACMRYDFNKTDDKEAVLGAQ